MTTRPTTSGLLAAVSAAAVLAGTLAAGAAPAAAGPRELGPQPVAVGSGGAVASVDADASAAGIEVLRHGGNAVDAAVAVAATLGVTEPYVAGLGGGGFLVYYDARSGTVATVDGRETAPAAMRPDSFLDPATGRPLAFADAVTSGLSVGVPGNLRTWQEVLDRWGTIGLADALRPAERVAERGFVVDRTFHDQTEQNRAKLSTFTTSGMWLPGGEPPAVGSVFRNPDLARTYRLIARDGVDALYRGEVGRDIVRTVQDPPVAAGVTRAVPRGLMTEADLAAYTALPRPPTHVTYRGLDVYGMAPPSSGGSTVGEALNILAGFDLSHMDRTQVLHHYLESTRLAFADRNRYVGDPDQVDVPLGELLSPGFAAERACLIDPDRALTSPVAPGSPDGQYDGCPQAAVSDVREPVEGTSTNHFVVADRWGNVVSYTNTIEQLAGSGITVPGRGFLLNNELTDFDFAPLAPGVPDPNLPDAGKRPRSSMSPTIVLRDGRPWLALGSPGGATIITTVLQILVNRVDLGMPLPEAIAAPRASQRNAALADAEEGFLRLPERPALEALGQGFRPAAEIGAATGLEFLGGGVVQAAAEPVRRGGGSAMVVHPTG
jgi:gamma-glutamyltranspeptidase / glutathione hydrolase